MTNDLQADIDAIAGIDAIAKILEVVCRTTGMGFAAVARVTEDHWIACAVRDEIAFGLRPGGELKVETTICHEVRGSGEAVVIDHVARDQTYRGHPTPAMYGFQSYISMPIVLPDGSFFGTLCAIDPHPAQLNRLEIIGMFRLFAELVAFHFDAQRRIALSETTLLDERATAELREQFIAVLGHDLRNPLASVDAGVHLLLRSPLAPKEQGILQRMQRSTQRMNGLIENVLDLARGRLGGGLTLTLADGEPLTPLLEQVIAEVQDANPERRIDADVQIHEPVRCDPVRIGQLASNLIANAVTHGTLDGTIRVQARTGGAVFELSVANCGKPIPQAVRERMFQPFFRGSRTSNQQGLGLGLYIASEIARAHAGTLELTSSPEETRFTFRMPIA